MYGTAVPVHGRDPTKFQHQVRFSVSGIDGRTDDSCRVSGRC